jgi:hypothetical protein
MKRIVSRGILTLGLVVVLLAATASSASAATSLSPTSTDFGNREVGTTSPAQAFTLRTFCPSSSIGCLIFGTDFEPNIDVSGDFSQTNNCPAILTAPPSEECTINVTFTPTSTGPKQSALCTNTQAGETGCRVGIGLELGPSATLTGNGVTTPTPPTPPTPGPPPPPPPQGPAPPTPGAPALQLDLDAKKQELKKKLTFFATTNVDATLVAEGSIKQTTKQLVGGEKTKIKGKLKSKKRKQLAQRLDRKGKAKAKVEAGAASETSGEAIAELKVKLKD